MKRLPFQIMNAPKANFNCFVSFLPTHWHSNYNWFCYPLQSLERPKSWRMERQLCRKKRKITIMLWSMVSKSLSSLIRSTQTETPRSLKSALMVTMIAVRHKAELNVSHWRRCANSRPFLVFSNFKFWIFFVSRIWQKRWGKAVKRKRHRCWIQTWTGRGQACRSSR